MRPINEKMFINKYQKIVKESSKINKITRKKNKKNNNLSNNKIRIGILKSPDIVIKK